jgi:hypothetical protein
MRPQQQNRRMRGRNNNGGGGSNNNNNNNNNNNRKGPNPLTRNYESNGPDVKIRGSAQQIAEKYATLARDAQSAGDRVMAENYLQHAEHYNRIIAAAQAQMPIQHVQQQNRDDMDDDSDQDFDNVGNAVNAPQHGNGQQSGGQEPEASQDASDGSGPQPVIEGTPAEVALNTETATEPTAGRGRGRRPRPPQAAPAPEPVAEAAPEAEAAPVAEATPAAEAAGEEAAPAPRRGRRPRRGERLPDEAKVEASGEASAEAAPDADGNTVLAAVNG